MHHTPPTSRGPLVVVLAMLLLVVYIGVYKLVVVPGGMQSGRKQDYYVVPGIGYSDPVDEVFSLFFKPANWFDRRIRPRVWEPTP